MRSKPVPQCAHIALVTLFVLGVAAFGVWTLAVGATASTPTSLPASAPDYAPASSRMSQAAVAPLSALAPVCGPNWTVISSPNVPTYDNYLHAVAAKSASDVWAVGSSHDSSANTDQTLVEHWDGSAWSVVNSSNVGGYNNYLFAVAAVSSTDVWAVGNSYNPNDFTAHTLIEHWDGSSWAIVYSPNIGTQSNYLYAVAAISSSDVWAVGHYYNGTAEQTLVEQWNGTSWTVVTSPNVGSSSNYLFGAAAVSAGDVWAVGYYYNGHYYQTLVEHWDGTSWAIVYSPNVGTDHNSLYAVAAISSSDVWAVGNYFGATAYQTLVEHWDGTSWSVVNSPNVGSSANFLTDVTAISSSDVWAAGYYYIGSTTQTLVEQWNGTSWVIVFSPNVGSGSNQLNGVAEVSATDIWAVGYYASSTSQTLVERYNPCILSPTPTHPVTPTATPTSCPIQYTDVPPGSTFYPYIHCLACRGIINGYADGTFKPNNQVIRGQLSKIVSNSAGFSEPQPNQMFQDVPVASTFQVYIGRLASRGYINGYPCGGAGEPCVPPSNLPYFRPNNDATRGQISKIDANAAAFSDPPVGQQFEDVPIGSAFYTYTYRLVIRSVMSGYPCGGAGEPCVPPANLPYFRPNNNATRGQTSKIVANTFFPNCQTPARK